MLRGNFPNNSPVHIASTDNKITHYEHYFGVGYSAEYNTIRFWFDIGPNDTHYGFIIRCHQRCHANSYFGYVEFVLHGKQNFYDLTCSKNIAPIPLFCVYPDTSSNSTPRYIDIVYVGPTSTQALFEFINHNNWSSTLGRSVKLNKVELLNTSQVPYFLQPGFVINRSNNSWVPSYYGNNLHLIYRGDTRALGTAKSLKIWKGFTHLLIKSPYCNSEFDADMTERSNHHVSHSLFTDILILKKRGINNLFAPRYYIETPQSSIEGVVSKVTLLSENNITYDGEDSLYYYFHIGANNSGEYDNHIIIHGMNLSVIKQSDTISLSLGEKKRNNNIGLLCLTFKERAPPLLILVKLIKF